MGSELTIVWRFAATQPLSLCPISIRISEKCEALSPAACAAAQFVRIGVVQEEDACRGRHQPPKVFRYDVRRVGDVESAASGPRASS